MKEDKPWKSWLQKLFSETHLIENSGHFLRFDCISIFQTIFCNKTIHLRIFSFQNFVNFPRERVKINHEWKRTFSLTTKEIHWEWVVSKKLFIHSVYVWLSIWSVVKTKSKETFHYDWQKKKCALFMIIVLFYFLYEAWWWCDNKVWHENILIN